MSLLPPTWLREWAIGVLRFWIIVGVVIGLFGAFVGIPHILTTYAGRSPHYTNCIYIGPFGQINASPGDDVPNNCPEIAFFKWGAKG